MGLGMSTLSRPRATSPSTWLGAALCLVGFGCAGSSTEPHAVETPTPTTVTVTPRSPRVGDALRCEASGEHAEAVALSWFVNDGWDDGPVWVGPLVRGEVASCAATFEGVVVAMDTVRVANSPPSVEAVVIAPERVGVGTRPTCSWRGFHDPDGDADRSTVEWLVRGVVVGTGSELSGGFVRGDDVICRVTPRDQAAAGVPVTAIVRAENAAPSVSRVTLLPERLDAEAGAITCGYEGYQDADGDQDKSTMAWTVNGFEAGRGHALTAQLVVGDVIVCTVTPSDGITKGVPVSARATFGNSAPRIAAVAIAPEVPHEGDELGCAWVGFSDADGDPDLSTISWRVDGQVVGGGAVLPMTLSVGAVVACRVSPYDGKSEGAWVEASVTVANRPPSVAAVRISPAMPSEGDLLGCSFEGYSDPEGDPNASWIAWLVNGVEVWSGSVLGAGFVTGDKVSCRVTPFDGSDAGEPISATVVIGALPPVLVARPDGPFVLLEDGAVELDVAADLLANDGEPGEPAPHFIGVDAASLAGGAITLLGAGRFRYRPPADFNGLDAVGYRIEGEAGLSANAQVRFAVSPLNDAPSFAAGADVTVAEDSGGYDAAWASAMSPGPPDEAAQALSFVVVTNSAPGLFATPPSVDPVAGRLSFTPAAGASGVAEVVLQLVDDGGAAQGGVDRSPVHTLKITVTSVNDAPNFTPGAHVTVAEDSGAYDAAWASDLSAGPADEASQGLSFAVVSDSAPELFATPPSVDPVTGRLAFAPAADASGVAEVVLQLVDDGGAVQGGVDRSPVHTLKITVTSVNDAPSFTPGPDVVIDEDSGPYEPVWASAIAPGPADESAQALSFVVVSNSAPDLFATQVKVDAVTGRLGLTPAPDAFGEALIELQLVDDGGTALGGADRSVVHGLRVDVRPVNDAPVLAALSDLVRDELTPVAFTAQATDLEGDSVTFALDAAPAGAAIDPLTGAFTWTPTESQGPGTYIFDVVATDDGAPPAAGRATLKIVVNEVNTPPELVFMAPLTLPEGTGATLTSAHLVGADADDGPDTFGFVLTAAPRSGTLSRGGVSLSVGTSFSQAELTAGAVRYTHTGSGATTDSFSFVLKDASGATAGVYVFWIVVTAPAPSHVLISALSTGGPTNEDYVELYNPTDAPIDLGHESYTLRVSDADAHVEATFTFSFGTIAAHGFFLIAGRSSVYGVDADGVASDLSIDTGGGVRLTAEGGVDDQLGTSTRWWNPNMPAGSAYFETRSLPPLEDGYAQAYVRKGGPGYGACVDSDANGADFFHSWGSERVLPRNSLSPTEACRAAPLAPMPGPAPQHVVIKEVRFDGIFGGSDEFIELFNASAAPVSMNGYVVRANNTDNDLVYSFPAGVTLAPGQHYLLGGYKDFVDRYQGTVDDTYTSTVKNGDGVSLYAGSVLIDAVATGSSSPRREGANLPKVSGRTDHSYERRDGGCRDTDDNLDDFTHNLTFQTPTRSTGPATPCGVIDYRYYLRITTAGTHQASVSPAALGLSTKAPITATLYNYDTDRDSAPGLRLTPSARLQVPVDADPQTFQRWAVQLPSGRALHGAATSLWAKLASGSGTGALYAHLQSCQTATDGCVTLATEAVAGDGGSWAEYAIDFGPLDDVIAPGGWLVLRVGVPAELAAGAMVVAFDTTSYPASLTLNPGADLALASVVDTAPAHVPGVFPAVRTYRYTLYSWGPDPASALALTADLAPGLSYVSSSGAGACGFDAPTGRLSCSPPLGALGPPWPVASSGTITVSAAAPGSYVTSFRIAPLGASDPNPDNDQATITSPLP